MRTFVVKWSGPFEDWEVGNELRVNCLYIITGCLKYERAVSLQYCGITERDLFKRLNDKNHKRDLVKRDRQYWVGNIISDEKIMRKDLEMVESLIIYFWQPELNDKKRKYPPEKTVVINRW